MLRTGQKVPHPAGRRPPRQGRSFMTIGAGRKTFNLDPRRWWLACLLGRNPLLRWTGSVMPNGTVRSNPSPTIGGRGRQ